MKDFMGVFESSLNTEKNFIIIIIITDNHNRYWHFCGMLWLQSSVDKAVNFESRRPGFQSCLTHLVAM